MGRMRCKNGDRLEQGNLRSRTAGRLWKLRVRLVTEFSWVSKKELGLPRAWFQTSGLQAWGNKCLIKLWWSVTSLRRLLPLHPSSPLCASTHSQHSSTTLSGTLSGISQLPDTLFHITSKLLAWTSQWKHRSPKIEKLHAWIQPLRGPRI